jgi:hypothetical protein
VPKTRNHLPATNCYKLSASLYLKKPERIMALLLVMTVCLLVYLLQTTTG